MNENVKRILAEYGMSDKEVRIYLAALALGGATVNELAKQSKVKRTSIYPIAEAMCERGFLGEFRAKYGTHFVATSPKSLIARLENVKSELGKIVPELEAITKKEPSGPSVKFFKGREGYLSVINESLRGYSHEVYYLGSAEDLNEIITDRFVTEKYVPERIKRNIRFRQIVFPDLFSKKLKLNDDKELRFTKFLPKEYFFKGNMVVFRNKVAYFSSKKELACVLIESDDISEIERKKFELLWDKLSE